MDYCLVTVYRSCNRNIAHRCLDLLLQVHILVQKELPILRQPRRSGARMDLLLSRMFMQAAQDKLLRVPHIHTQKSGCLAEVRHTGSVQRDTSRPMEKEQAGPETLLFLC